MKPDVLLATLLALALAGSVAFLSPGPVPTATFVPALALAWVLYMLRTRHGILPDRERFTPPFLAAMIVQLAHFAEEFAGDFQTRLPREVYGAERGLTDGFFVTLNALAYALFLAAYLGTVWYRLRPPAVVLWFAVVLMCLGNALGHALACLSAGGYFPGFWTSLPYWFLGPVLFLRMWRPDCKGRVLA